MTSESIYCKNFIVYEIVYIPWENNRIGLPWKYIGSTVRNLETYFGTVKSKMWKSWWFDEVKRNPNNFRKRVIFNCIVQDRNILLEVEEVIQRYFEVVKNPEYFNKSYATKGIFGSDVSGENNPNYGNRMNQSQKMNHSFVMSRVNNRPEKRLLNSKIQKICQNTQVVKDKKSKSQSERWKTSEGLRFNSSKTQFKPTRIELLDCTFVSHKNFKLFMKEHNLVMSKNMFDHLRNWTIKDCFVYNEILKYAFLNRIGLNKTIEIISYCNDNNYKKSYNAGNGINNRSIINKFEVEEHYNVVSNLITAQQGNYRNFLNILIDLKLQIDNSNDSYLKGFLDEVNTRIK